MSFEEIVIKTLKQLAGDNVIMETIIIQTYGGNKTTTKTDILKALKSFDEREPDKTLYIWEHMAKWLYMSQEIKPREGN